MTRGGVVLSRGVTFVVGFIREVSSTAVRGARLSRERFDRLTGEKKNNRVTAGES